MLQKSFHTKIGQGRTEKYRGKFSLCHKFHIKFRTGTVKKFDFVIQN